MVSVNASKILEECRPLNAVAKAPTLSKNYKFVSSRHVIDLLGNEGWEPSKAFIVKSKSSSDPLYKRHCIRFRNPSMMGDESDSMGGTYPEIVMRNSHDGTTSLQFLAGIMRMVCSNGLTIAEEEYGATRMRHDSVEYRKLGDIWLNAVVKRFARAVPDGMALCKGWNDMHLDKTQKHAYYKEAGKLRGIDMYDYRYNQFNRATRAADVGDDLWTVFNRTQEWLVDGGIKKYNDFTDDRVGGRTQIALRNSDAIDAVNTGLWNLTTRTAEMLAGVN